MIQQFLYEIFPAHLVDRYWLTYWLTWPLEAVYQYYFRCISDTACYIGQKRMRMSSFPNTVSKWPFWSKSQFLYGIMVVTKKRLHKPSYCIIRVLFIDATWQQTQFMAKKPCNETKIGVSRCWWFIRQTIRIDVLYLLVSVFLACSFYYILRLLIVVYFRNK